MNMWLGCLLVLPCIGAIVLLWRHDDRFLHHRLVFVVMTLLIAVGSLGLAIMTPEMLLGELSDPIISPADAGRWSLMADRFSLAIAAALMTMLAASALLLPDDSPSVWLLTTLFTGGLLPLWWSQSVWGIAGTSVVLSFLALLVPAVNTGGLSAATRRLWLSTTIGDMVLIVAIVAGIGGIGDAAVQRYGDPQTVHDFAAMRAATGMFVAFWSWLGVLSRAGQFPFCVSLDAVRNFSPRAWVLAAGVGVFAVGHRWCDLHCGWWSASPAMTNLILSAALVSAVLCAWFALATSDLRVRIGYLTAAHFSLALGPLTTGSDVDRAWAAAVMLGTLSLSMWFWSVMIFPVTAVASNADEIPTWTRILTGGNTASVIWTFTSAARPQPTMVLSFLPASTRGIALMMVILWCGMSIAVGSWWWGDEPLPDTIPSVAAVEPTNAVTDLATEAVRTRPNGRLPVSTIAVMLSALAIASGVRSALRSPAGDEQPTQTSFIVSGLLGVVPIGLILAFSQPQPVFWPIMVQCSPALACLVLMGVVIGWITAGWSETRRAQLSTSLAVVREMGERRLYVPELLQFGANFPLRGLAQLVRFLDWSVLEIGCRGSYRRLPELLRHFADDLRHAGNGSDVLVLWTSGIALIATLLWLAQSGH